MRIAILLDHWHRATGASCGTPDGVKAHELGRGSLCLGRHRHATIRA
jgi:hypothetical protein